MGFTPKVPFSLSSLVRWLLISTLEDCFPLSIQENARPVTIPKGPSKRSLVRGHASPPDFAHLSERKRAISEYVDNSRFRHRQFCTCAHRSNKIFFCYPLSSMVWLMWFWNLLKQRFHALLSFFARVDNFL